ncbi:MAG: hypothetical protein IH851_06820 [Armatimonadetes bacterium]|nr:hypothetical protein [Armatimonadota bacterium]
MRKHKPDNCLEAEALIELAERGRRARDYEAGMNHVATCSECRAALKELERVEELRREHRRGFSWVSGRWTWAVVAPAAAVLVIGVLIVRPWEGAGLAGDGIVATNGGSGTNGGTGGGTEPDGFGDGTPDTPQPKPPEVIEEPGGGEVYYAIGIRAESGRIYEGDQRLPDWTRDYLEPLRTTPTIVEGLVSTDGPSVRLTRPDYGNRGLVDVTPAFEWERVPGATGYEADLELLAGPAAGQAEEMPGALIVEEMAASLTAGLSLERGQSYRLTIRVVRRFQGPEGRALPDAAVFVFDVLTEEQASEVEWARANREATPIASAMTLHALGMYADALDAIRSAPEDQTVRLWRRKLEQDLQKRLSDPSEIR